MIPTLLHRRRRAVLVVVSLMNRPIGQSVLFHKNNNRELQCFFRKP
jgi:hypothetical protein